MQFEETSSLSCYEGKQTQSEYRAEEEGNVRGYETITSMHIR